MNHKDLEVWKQAMLLVEKIYTITDVLPTKETYGLISQMRRAVVSVPSNIDEGSARKSDKELVQFLYVALGSCAELETQIIICQRLFNLETKEILDHLETCRKLL